MCGLAGFARHPEGARLDVARILLDEMIVASERRGRHATGVAILSNETAPVIFKRACDATKCVASDPWKQTMDRMPARTLVAMGHTRYATHNNAHLDEAAHPFQEGRVVGAHNGIVHNWKEVAKKLEIGKHWINDSQAPFGALDRLKNPIKALDLLDGYWALTWVKGDALFLCRTNEAPLGCAYVKEMRTLFWMSELNTLTTILKNAKVAYEAWQVAPGTLYQYDPTKFDAEGTHAVKTDAPFRGRHAAQWRGVDSTNRNALTTNRVWGGHSTTQRSSAPPANATDAEWNAWLDDRRFLPRESRDARDPVRGAGAASGRAKGGRKPKDDVMDLLADLSARLEKVEAENAYLFNVVQEAGLLDLASVEPPKHWAEPAVEEDSEDEEDDVQPYRDPRQPSLFEPGGNTGESARTYIRRALGEQEPIAKDAVCEVCEGRGWDSRTGLFLKTPTGHVHENCIFKKVAHEIGSKPLASDATGTA
jgi:hypothetical protein